MSFELIIETIKNLNEDWYNSKKSFFILEPCYDKKLKKIIIKGNPVHWEHEDEETGKYNEGLYYPDMIKYPLSQYIWISKFEGCLAFNNIEIIDDFPSEIHNLPIDGAEVSESLMKYYKSFFKSITDHSLIAKEVIANLKDIAFAFEITKDSSDFDKTKHDIFRSIYNKVYDVYGSHIILFNSHTKKSIDRLLTIDICNKIANFKIKNKRLITSVVPAEQDKAAILLFLLTDVYKGESNSKIYIEDWGIQDFYYLLSLIKDSFSNINTLSQIDENEGFVLKRKKFFKSNSFSKFKSDKQSVFKNTSETPSLIDELMHPFLKR